MRVIDLKSDPERAYKDAADVLQAGGLIAYPTESYYAMGADAMNPEAVRGVFRLKKRAAGKPLPVILGDVNQIEKFTERLSFEAKKAVAELMPGPITLVFHASSEIPDELTAGTGKIGIRVPKHVVMSRLALAFGGPITATSANLSGEEGFTSAEKITDAFSDEIDLVLDGGVTPGPPASSLLDMTVSPPRLLREGLGLPVIERVFPAVKPISKGR